MPDFDGIEVTKDLPTGDHRELCQYKDLYEYISFEGFSFNLHLWCEEHVLQPRLEALGYTDIMWFDGEADFFGPLSRICRATHPDGNIEQFIYG